MTAADVIYLSDLWVASWQEALPDIAFSERRAWIASVLDNPALTTLVAEDGNGPVGFATMEADYLHQIVVAPAAKGGRAARGLLDATKVFSAHGLTLEVNQANARALRFYEREGFAIEAASSNPTSGLPTWRMRWLPVRRETCDSEPFAG